jgi:DNA-binding MarR family transcriptional regulator
MKTTRNPPYALSASEVRTAGSAADAVGIFRLVVYCGSRLRYRFDQRLREDDLTSQQGILLTVVRTRGRPKLGEVARAMATSHQNAKQIATALERKGMLRIEKDASDGRARRLTITAAGTKAWKSRDAGDFKAVGNWLSDLSRTEQRSLRTLLKRLAETIP